MIKKSFLILKKIGLGLIALLVLLACTGVLYQSISTKLEEKRYPPPGTLVDVGGYRLHLHSMGTGGPTVILDAGLGCTGSDWALVQPEIAQFAQVVSYDRAGNGWSEKSLHPRTSQAIVEELHTLLQNAKIPGPYILVGHSFGGINVQLYAITYPNEVLGLVLVDSAHEEQEKKLPVSPLNSQMKLMQSPGIVRCMATLGITRLGLKATNELMMPSLPKSIQNVHIALCSTIKHCCASTAEARSLSESLKQLEQADRTRISGKPCFVVSAGSMPRCAPELGLTEEFVQEGYVVWTDLQADLASKFKQCRQVIAENSDHMILWNQPEVIVRAVQQLVNENRFNIIERSTHE